MNPHDLQPVARCNQNLPAPRLLDAGSVNRSTWRNSSAVLEAAPLAARGTMYALRPRFAGWKDGVHD